MVGQKLLLQFLFCVLVSSEVSKLARLWLEYLVHSFLYERIATNASLPHPMRILFETMSLEFGVLNPYLSDV